MGTTSTSPWGEEHTGGVSSGTSAAFGAAVLVPRPAACKCESCTVPSRWAGLTWGFLSLCHGRIHAAADALENQLLLTTAKHIRFVLRSHLIKYQKSAFSALGVSAPSQPLPFIFND